MKIHNIAQKPRDTADWGEVIRFMVQSLSAENDKTINFLVSCWSFYLANGELTPRQASCVNDILQEFFDLIKKGDKNPKPKINLADFEDWGEHHIIKGTETIQ